MKDPAWSACTALAAAVTEQSVPPVEMVPAIAAELIGDVK